MKLTTETPGVITLLCRMESKSVQREDVIIEPAYVARCNGCAWSTIGTKEWVEAERMKHIESGTHLCWKEEGQ